MPGPEDRLKGALERLAAPADPTGAYERIVEKKVRRLKVLPVSKVDHTALLRVLHAATAAA